MLHRDALRQICEIAYFMESAEYQHNSSANDTFFVSFNFFFKSASWSQNAVAEHPVRVAAAASAINTRICIRNWFLCRHNARASAIVQFDVTNLHVSFKEKRTSYLQHIYFNRGEVVDLECGEDGDDDDDDDECGCLTP